MSEYTRPENIVDLEKTIQFLNKNCKTEEEIPKFIDLTLKDCSHIDHIVTYFNDSTKHVNDTCFFVSETGYPNIGKPIMNVLSKIKEEQANGTTFILWTLRQGQNLQNAIDKLKEHRIIINHYLPGKQNWTEIWDDRSKHLSTI